MKSQEQTAVRNMFPELKTYRNSLNGTHHRNSASPRASIENSLPCSYVPILSIKLKMINKRGKNHAKHTFARARGFLCSGNTWRCA